MQTPIERLLFILLVAICLTAAYTTFKLMADIVMQGQGQLRLDNLFQRLVVGAVRQIATSRIKRSRSMGVNIWVPLSSKTIYARRRLT